MHLTPTPAVRTYACRPLASNTALPHVFRRRHATQRIVTRSLCGCGRPLTGRHRYIQCAVIASISHNDHCRMTGSAAVTICTAEEQLFVDYLSPSTAMSTQCMALCKTQSACRLPASHRSRPSRDRQLHPVLCRAKLSSFDINEVGWDIIEIADMDVDSMKLHQLKSELKARRQTVVGMLCLCWQFASLASCVTYACQLCFMLIETQTHTLCTLARDFELCAVFLLAVVHFALACCATLYLGAPLVQASAV